MRWLDIFLWHQLLISSSFAAGLFDFVFQSPHVQDRKTHQSEQSLPGKDIWDLVPATGTSAELNLISRLKSYTDRPRSVDCFRHSVSTVTSKCGEELESDEGARVRLAISMTLCELQTAAHPAIPSECSPFSPLSQVHRLELQAASQAACVTALSLSPQYWSSYSGYLRDIPQLCFAFRRWHETDTAYVIQRNTSLEALNLLTLLREREEVGSKQQNAWKQTTEDMKAIKQDLFGAFSKLQEISLKAFVGTERSISEMLQHWSEVADRTYEELSLSLQRSHTSAVQKLHRELMNSAQVHSQALESAFERMEGHSAHSRRLLQQQNELVTNTLVSLDNEWQAFTSRIASLHNSVEVVLELAAHTSSELITQSSKIYEHQGAIEQASRSLTTLVASMDRLANLTDDRLISINRTAWEVQSSVSVYGTLGWLIKLEWDMFRGVYLRLKNLETWHIHTIAALAYHMLPAFWYVLRGITVLWWILVTGIRQTGVCIAALISVAQLVLPKLLFAGMPNKVQQPSPKDDPSDIYYRCREPLAQSTAKATTTQVLRLDTHSRNSLPALPTSSRGARKILAYGSSRELFRSSSLPPLLNERPRE